MEKILEQFNFHTASEADLERLRGKLEDPLREATVLKPVLAVLSVLNTKLADPNFPERDSVATKTVDMVTTAMSASDLNRNDMKTMRRAMFDCYVTCWTAGPTSGHVECMPEIRKHTDNYMDLNITDEDLTKLINALKIDLSQKKIKIDQEYVDDLKEEVQRILYYTIDEKHYDRRFADFIPLYNHFLMRFGDKEEDELMNKLMISLMEGVHSYIKFEYKWKNLKDKSVFLNQMKVIESVGAKHKGKMADCRDAYRPVEDGLRPVLNIMKEKGAPASELTAEWTALMFKLLSHGTDLSTALARIIARHANNNKWPKTEVDMGETYLSDLAKAVENGDVDDTELPKVVHEGFVHIVAPQLKNGAYDKPLLALLHACIKKRSYGYLDVFYALMEKDYDKHFKWKANTDECKKILQTVLSLNNVSDDEADEKEKEALYERFTSCMRYFVEKFEKFRTLPAVSDELARIWLKAVLDRSVIHWHAMAYAYQHVVWKGNTDHLVKIVCTMCEYIDTPDDYAGVFAEDFGYYLMFAFRAIIELKLEGRVADKMLVALEKCLGKPYANEDDPDKKSVYYEVAYHILSEFCRNIMEKSEVGSPFVPIILKYSVEEPEDSFGEYVRDAAHNMMSWASHYGKTIGEHADTLIDTKLENDQTEGLISMALTTFPNHPEKILPRLDHLIDIADDGNQTDQCQIIQLLHLVVKRNPEMWNDKMHKKVLKGFDTDNMGGLALFCLADVYPKHPARLIEDMEVMMPLMKEQSIQINMMYQVFPQVASVSQEYAVKVLTYLDELMSVVIEIQVQSVLLMSYRSIASSHKVLVAERRPIFEEKKEVDALSEIASGLLDYLDGKSLENVYDELDEKGKDIDKLDNRVTKTEDDVVKVTNTVDKHGRDIKHIKEDVTKAEVKLDNLTDTVEEMGEKVEEIDHKTLDHAPAWSRDVSVLLNPESAHDWRLLAQRLGYSKADIRGWATQADPCMAMLNEWFATHKTSEAVHGVHKALLEMNRTDAADIVKKAMDAAENIIEDDAEETGEPPPVFISYQWGHQSEVKLLKRHLEMAGYKAWMDIGQMGGGDKLFAKIDQGMRAAKVVICCVTDKYAKSDNCTREVNLAVTVGKPIIPLLIEKSTWPPEGAMGPIFGEYLFIRFWQRGGEVTSSDDQRYWPLMKFSELLMQIRLYIAPDQSILTDLYKDWCNPVEEYIEIVNQPPSTQEGKKESKKIENNVNSKAEVIQTKTKTHEDVSPEVFISYQWGKQPQIRKLFLSLSKLGFSCWMDIHQMGGGDSLYEKIDKGIRGCQVVVSCCTKKYSLSANCRREVSLADALKKPIVPILLEEMPWPPEGAMSMVLTQLLYINFSRDLNLQEDWSGDLFDELIKRITKYSTPQLVNSAVLNNNKTPNESKKNDTKTKTPRKPNSKIPIKTTKTNGSTQSTDAKNKQQAIQAKPNGKSDQSKPSKATKSNTVKERPTQSNDDIAKENTSNEVAQPEGVTASVKFLGSKKAFDTRGEWNKIRNVTAATAALNSNRKSSSCCIL